MLPVSVSQYCLGYEVKLQKCQIQSHCAICLVLNINILLTQGSLLVDGLGNIGLNDNRAIYRRQNKSLNKTYMTQV